MLARAAYPSQIACVGRQGKWAKVLDNPIVELTILGLGVLLVIGGLVISPVPGPGGAFLIAPGVALILKTSMWAKRRYVNIKRWQPGAGRWMDWALRRPRAKRREALRKAEQAGAGN